jgi:hypothetical protein
MGETDELEPKGRALKSTKGPGELGSSFCQTPPGLTLGTLGAS